MLIRNERSGCEVRGVSPGPGGSLSWERFVNLGRQVSFEPGMKERGVMDSESCLPTEGKMERKVRDR